MGEILLEDEYHYLGDNFYKREIQKLFQNFEERKSFIYILDNWEMFKLEVKKVTKSFSILRAKHRTNTILICNEMKERYFDMEIMQNIMNKEQEIKNFISKGNMIRSKSEVLNKVYEEGREINRKEEIKKGNYKFIHQLRTKDDKPIMDKEKILNEIKEFYQSLFTSQKIKEKDIEEYLFNFKSSELKNEDREMLNNYISEQEVREAIRDLNIDKSPGDDGITAEFYQAFNLAIVPIVTEVFNNIWLNDEMPSSKKNGIIQLIYKKKGTVTNLKYWRPITLLNLDYKILTKILANRLKLCIDYLLNYNLSSGVKQRDILDNILNLKTLLDYVKAKNLNAAFISLNNEKAFDRLEHNYMFKVLEKFNFPNRYIRWIKFIYNDINSKVMVNGKLTEKIHIEQSVRQGCPISIYVLCLEPLILRINDNTRIKGISIPNCPDEIKTIQHADDMTVMIITDISYKELEKENILFSKVSGSKIIMDKTEVLLNGFFEVIPKCYIKDTIKVLGCFFLARMKLKIFKMLI